MRHRPVIALVLVALAVGGCGLGAGDKPAGTTLTVTRDFGLRELHRTAAPKVAGSETVMRLLSRNAKVTTRYGGGFVQSIDGVRGGEARGHPVDWFFYVNGVESPRGAAAVRVAPGDRVWWDHHDWSATQTIPAVVGSFPEPFLHGFDGKRVPTRVECADPRGGACRTVSDRLARLGVPVARGGIGGARVVDTLRLIVAPLSTLRNDPVVSLLSRGPQASGVYVRVAPDGRWLTMLDADGRPTQRLGAASGLIAAVKPAETNEPVWIVAGTDAAGTDAAASAFSEDRLRDRFALAVSGRTTQSLPDGGR